MSNKKGTITAVSSKTVKGIIKAANELGIQKEDIVTLVQKPEEYILIYYEYGE